MSAARDTHPATLPDEALLRQCRWSRGRGSGPGGQRRNKVETAAVVVHLPTGVTAQASERRSWAENQRVALRRLRMALALQVRCAPLRAKGLDAEETSPLWRSRRTPGGGLAINPRHRDYPALLAEALDMLADSGWSASKAARRLGVTTSQLLRLVRRTPRAWELLNQQRREHGEKPLR